MNILVKDVLLGEESISLYVSEGKIEKILKSSTSESIQAELIINGKGKALFPFLHNGHTHSPMVLLRGYGDDMALDAWLREKIWPVESRLTEKDYYWGNRLALLEMIKSGTGFFNEMYMNPASLIEALREFPMKALINFPIIDGMDEESGRKQIEECLQFFQDVKAPDNVQLGLALHSVYANSPYSLEWAGSYAREKGLPLHIHLCETEKEIVDCRKDHKGLSPVQYLESLDFFRDNRVYGAHSVWLDEKDISLMAEHQIVAVHNPVSNMKLATGQAFPYAALKEAGVPMVLGTDGAASNNNLDLLEEMKIAALLQKHHFVDPTLMKADEIFSMVTEKSADLFQTGSGKIEEGAAADFMLIRTDHPSMVPLTDIISNLVYSANSSAVSDLVVMGRPLMIEGRIEGEETIRKEALQCASRLTGGSE